VALGVRCEPPGDSHKIVTLEFVWRLGSGLFWLVFCELVGFGLGLGDA